jgi:molecular chaperone GrpE (heat shock protein)
MIDGFYLIVVVAFATATVFTLFNHLIRGNEIREETVELGTKLKRATERVVRYQKELDELRARSRALSEERAAIEAQGKCMTDLLETYQLERGAE